MMKRELLRAVNTHDTPLVSTGRSHWTLWVLFGNITAPGSRPLFSSINIPSGRRGYPSWRRSLLSAEGGQFRCERKLIDTTPWSIPTATVEGSDFWNQMGYIFVISVIRGILRKSQLWICRCGAAGLISTCPVQGIKPAQCALCGKQSLCSCSQSRMQITSANLPSLLGTGSVWVWGLSPRGTDLSDVHTSSSWCWIMHSSIGVVI